MYDASLHNRRGYGNNIRYHIQEVGEGMPNLVMPAISFCISLVSFRGDNDGGIFASSSSSSSSLLVADMILCKEEVTTRGLRLSEVVVDP